MNLLNAVQIEKKILHLPPAEQLWIAERILHRLGQKTLNPENLWQNRLAEMAADPEIQNEIGKIGQEFTITESDGLENI